MDTMVGTVIYAQESRFQLVDRDGIAHLFILSPSAAAEPEQLPALQRDQARVRVGYVPAEDLLAHKALRIDRLDR